MELEKYAAEAKKSLRLRLVGLTKAQMVTKIKGMLLSDRSLNFLCYEIALPTEDYEICMAVQVIQQEREHARLNRDTI